MNRLDGGIPHKGELIKLPFNKLFVKNKEKRVNKINKAETGGGVGKKSEPRGIITDSSQQEATTVELSRKRKGGLERQMTDRNPGSKGEAWFEKAT